MSNKSKVSSTTDVIGTLLALIVAAASSGCAEPVKQESAWAPLPPGMYVFVVNARTDEVGSINANTLAPIGQPIRVGRVPSDIALSPDASRAYVVSPSDNSVTVLDTKSGTTIGDPIRVDRYPAGLVVSPDGATIYVAGGETDDVRAYDAKSHRQIGEPIRIGDAPGGLAISPDGRWIYATSQYQNDVRVIDTRTLSVVGNPITVGKRPIAATVSRDGNRVYVASWGSDSVSVIGRRELRKSAEVTTQVIGQPIPVGRYPSSLVVSADGLRVFVVDQNSDTVSVIDTKAMKVVHTIPTGDAPTTIAISPDGHRTYTANMYADTVTVIDTATLKVIATSARVGQAPRGIAVVNSPNVNPPGPASASLSIVRNDNAISVGGELPDDTAKASLLDTLRSAFGPDINLADHLNIDAGVGAPDLSVIGSLFTAAVAVPNFNFDLKGDTLRLTGASSGDVKAAIEAAARAAWPNVKVIN